MNWQDFFKAHSLYRVETYFYDSRDSFTLEELYQAFRARLFDELRQLGSTGTGVDWAWIGWL